MPHFLAVEKFIGLRGSPSSNSTCGGCERGRGGGESIPRGSRPGRVSWTAGRGTSSRTTRGLGCLFIEGDEALLLHPRPIASAHPTPEKDRPSKWPILKECKVPGRDSLSSSGRFAPDLFGPVWQQPWISTHHNNAAPIRSTESACGVTPAALRPWIASLTNPRQPTWTSSQIPPTACPSVHLLSKPVKALVSRTLVPRSTRPRRALPTGNHPRASSSPQNLSPPNRGRHSPSRKRVTTNSCCPPRTPWEATRLRPRSAS